MLNKFLNGWYLWLFPILAVGISGWMIRDYYRQRGDLVTIEFEDAAGIQAEKTTVRFRGIAIGIVKDVKISPDQKSVLAQVAFREDAMSFAVAKSKFSLITPKVNFQGVSGLETLFNGTYISVLPGPIDGEPQGRFKAVANANATDPLDDTSAYLIEAKSVESINTGVSVSYHGLRIGSVTKLTLEKDARNIQIQINIENRYARLIRANTQFWRKEGVRAKLGLFGSDIKVNSLDSIVNGGVELATPAPAGGVAKAFQKFGLEPAPPKNFEKWETAID